MINFKFFQKNNRTIINIIIHITMKCKMNLENLKVTKILNINNLIN